VIVLGAGAEFDGSAGEPGKSAKFAAAAVQTITNGLAGAKTVAAARSARRRRMEKVRCMVIKPTELGRICSMAAQVNYICQVWISTGAATFTRRLSCRRAIP
jgi:hypothetical protein